MCLAVVGIRAHARFELVIAANRDEHHAREALPAAWWPEGLLAGRDLAAGGTWLGITRTGRWAFLTNVREPERKDPFAPTRGALVTRVLASGTPPYQTLEEVAGESAAYNGFNLIAGTAGSGAWLSNRSGGPRRLAPGIHGISNAALDTPWPKVLATRARFEAWCNSGERDPAPLFAALAVRDLAPDDALPRTGVPLERERQLSAPFIVTPEYGTRCSTVVLVGADRTARFLEQSFDALGRPTGTVDYTFEVS